MKSNIKFCLKSCALLALLLLFSCPFTAQEKNRKADPKAAARLIYEGSNQYIMGNLKEAQNLFEQARIQDPENFKAAFNLGNTHYHLKNFDAARTFYQGAANISGVASENLAKTFHNEGNTWMEQKKYKEAIEAYKKSLRLVPNAPNTKYNLAYAQKMLDDNEQEEQDNQQNQENKDQNQDQNQDQQQNKDEQQNQQNPSQLTKKQAEALLNALNQEEKKVQEKQNDVQGMPSSSGIDW